MTFGEALQAMIEGHRVRRPGWKKLTCIFIQDGKMYSEVDGVSYYYGQIAQQCVMATDWEILRS